MPLFILLVISLEIFLFVQLSSAIGFVWALILLFSTGIVGTKFIRFESKQSINKILGDLQGDDPSGMEIPQSLILLFAGFLIVLPGFFTDFIGFLLLIPPLRQWLMVSVVRKILKDVLATLGGYDVHQTTYSQKSEPLVYKDVNGDNVIEGEFERKDDHKS